VNPNERRIKPEVHADMITAWLLASTSVIEDEWDIYME
jgi:hypothetical protein